MQTPEGLKTKILEIAAKLEKEGKEVLISCEPCYGACDIRDSEAQRLECKKIIHIGHNKMVESATPVDYLEHRSNVDILPLKKEFKKIDRYKRIGLVTSLQFLDCLNDVKDFLEDAGKKVEIGKSRKLYPGQILGCDVSAAKTIENKIDCFLFIGSGKFHALGAVLKTEKPVFILDVERKKIDTIDIDKFSRQSIVAKELAKDAKTFGILISTKPGQLNLGLAEKIKNEIENRGRKAFLLVFDEIKPEKLEGLDLDCYINTACPRITIEDRTAFKKPLLDWREWKEIFK